MDWQSKHTRLSKEHGGYVLLRECGDNRFYVEFLERADLERLRDALDKELRLKVGPSEVKA
jgi:hypothetical protein